MLEELEKEIKEILEISERAPKHYEYNGNNTKVRQVLENLETEHNTSWAIEMYRRNCDNLDSNAIKYRGNLVNYREMFERAYMYAKALKQMGYQKGDEIPVCVSNIPEFIYLLLAISFIGARINVVGDWFNKNYLLSILNNTNSKYIFVSDDVYDKIADVINSSTVENIVMFSLEDSLPLNRDGIKYNPYEKYDNLFYKITNKTKLYEETSQKKILDVSAFLQLGNSYSEAVVEKVSLDAPFAITYTSGTTDPGCPKGCLHSNRSYITLSRFKESDVSGMPSMRNLTVLAHIPTYTHMELSCAISDTLFEKCTLAMEPFYSKESFIYSLIINEPNFVPAGAGFWTHVCKLLNYDARFKNINMPYLMIPTVTGEACSSGEEKFFNYTSRKHKFGTAKLPFPLAPVTFSIGGGTSESSGIFVTLFKSLQEKQLQYLIKKDTLGLTPHKFADIEVLNENGDYCQLGEPGLLVGNSPCSMMGYTDPKLNKNIYITDRYGKTWLNMGTYSYKSDSYGRIKMKGRMGSNIYSSNGQKIPYYLIEDEISKDTKNIMSCSLVKVVENDVYYYVCHIELQPNAKLAEEKVIESAIMRLNKILPQDILNILYLRVRSFEESFPLAPSGKRNTTALIEEGITEKCIDVSKYINKHTNNKVRKLTRKDK